MPSRREVLAAAAGTGLLAATPAAGAVGRSRTSPADRSTTTPEEREERPFPWPMYRGDAANTGALPGAEPPVGPPAVVWERDVGSVPSAPAPVPGGVVVPGDTVSVHDADDGARGWSAKPAAPAYRQPVVAHGTVYLGHEAGVEALALDSGERRWLVRTPGQASTVAVAEDLLYADVEDGPLLAVEAEDGSERWRLDREDPLSRAPTVDGGVVYVGGKELLAVEAATGALRWGAPVPDETSELGTVAASGGRVFGVGNVDAERAIVAAYDADDGSQLWSNSVVKTVNTSVGDPVAVGGEVVAALGGVRSLDAATGEQRWTTELDTTHGATPAVAGAVAILRADRETLRAVDLADRSVLWSLPLDATLSTAPVVGHGRTYVGDESGTLYAVGGEELGRTATAEGTETFGYDWVDSWAPTAGVLGGAHVVAPLVLGGLLGVVERLGDPDDED
jgi:outer membrane protein assembly factor BamB